MYQDPENVLSGKEDWFGDFQRVLQDIANNDHTITEIGPTLWNENKIGNIGLAMLGDALANNTNIKQCYLYNQGINSAEAMHAFTQSLSNNYNNAIHTLFLHENPLSLLCIECLCHLLRSPQCKITELALDSTGLGDAGSVCILQALIHNTSLTRLSMESNGISDVGLDPLAGVLRVHPKLTKLWLQNNKIVSFPVEAAMLHNLKLETLSLTTNPLNSVGIAELCHLLRSPQCKITILWLDSDRIGRCGQRVHPAGPPTQHINHCTLYNEQSNGISDVGLGPLAGVLRVHPKLNTLVAAVQQDSVVSSGGCHATQPQTQLSLSCWQ